MPTFSQEFEAAMARKKFEDRIRARQLKKLDGKPKQKTERKSEEKTVGQKETMKKIQQHNTLDKFIEGDKQGDKQ